MGNISNLSIVSKEVDSDIDNTASNCSSQGKDAQKPKVVGVKEISKFLILPFQSHTLR